MTSVHPRTAVGDAAHNSWQDNPTDDDPASTDFIPRSRNHDYPFDSEDYAPTDATTDNDDDPEWTWAPPDLSEGGTWREARIALLKEATKDLDDGERRCNEGLEALRKHRENYGPDGPKYLQLLWWEFPQGTPAGAARRVPDEFPQHASWRHCSEPRNGTRGSSHLCQFVDELQAHRRSAASSTGVTLEPMLLLCEKAAQLDQWRSIADMK